MDDKLTELYDQLIEDLKESQHLQDGSEYGLKVALYEVKHLMEADK